MSEELLSTLIHRHADSLKLAGRVRTPIVEQAFRTVPRHLFLPATFYLDGSDEESRLTYSHEEPDPAALEVIYSGQVLVTEMNNGQATSSSSSSALVADMLELLCAGESMRVLEIGTGSGYNAALIAKIVGDRTIVRTMDNQPHIVEHVRSALIRAGVSNVLPVQGDGFYGLPASAPFDRVVVTASCPDLSPSWVEQLAPGGFIILPFHHGGIDLLLKVECAPRQRRCPAGNRHVPQQMLAPSMRPVVTTIRIIRPQAPLTPQVKPKLRVVVGVLGP